jgi:hypothetical protein
MVKSHFLIATPEKALCDLIITKSGFRVQSVKALSEYLIQDIRLDFNIIKN